MSHTKRSRSNSPSNLKSPATSPTSLQQNSKKVAIDENILGTIMDEKLKRQSDLIISLITNKLKENNEILKSQMVTQFAELKESISDINARVNQLENNASTLNSQHKTVKTDINEINTSLSNVHKALADAQSQILDLNSQINTFTLKQEEMENKNVSRDAILFGIPNITNENINSYFEHICQVISIQPPTLKDIFRTRPHPNSNTSTTIIIKFQSAYDRNYVLASIAKFRKDQNRQLKLSDAGLDSNSNIYLRECLTKNNNNILHTALQLKKQKSLFSVFTMRGNVFVKRHQNEDEIKIENIAKLNDIASLQS